MEAAVIIYSVAGDPHAGALAWALQKNRTRYVLQPSIRSDERARLSIHVGEMADTLTYEGVDSTRIRSSWYRRPLKPQVGSCHEADRNFIEEQWQCLQKNIFDVADNLTNALWVNRPRAAHFAESKLAQLQAARAAGLQIPETLIGNHAPDIAALIRRCGKVVFKTFYPHTWQSERSGAMFDVGVTMLDSDSELPEQAIALSPGIYQRYIEKAFDLRVTIIGHKLFAAKIQRTHGGAYVDWRPHSYDEDIRFESFAINAALEAKLQNLMSRLGIVFGCVDLAVDNLGDIYFLEVNQAGQFLFVEEALPELPLTRAMAAMLSAGRTDYGVEDCIKVSLADYLCSEEYRSLPSVPSSIGPRVTMEP
jgi:glutathione synthase/RimK-type ligase-like ATP-grasp enzyme